MKSLLIVVLIVALGASAFFTRPNRSDFARYIVKQQTVNEHNPLARAADHAIAEELAKQCTFQDRYFWVNVKQDDRTIYTGAFAHWFNRAEVKNAVREKAHEVDQQIHDRLRDEAHNLGKSN